MPELLIIGTGGLAKECGQLARRMDPGATRWPSIVYVTNEAVQLGGALPYGRIGMTDAELPALTRAVDVVIGIGHPAVRQRIAASLGAHPHCSFPNLVDPDVVLDAHYLRLGQGNIVTRGVVMTVDIEIGDFNLFNWNVTVGHDARIGSCNVINPGSSVSGNVTLGDAILVGTGARILENLTVCSQAAIGAGAVVTRSLSQPGVYTGVPAQLRNSS